MTEIDVDMAIHSMSQAVEALLAAARDKDGSRHVAANRQRLIEEVGRLYDSLAAREPATAERRAKARPAAAARAVRSDAPQQRRVA